MIYGIGAIGLLGVAGALVLRPARKRTDADRLRDLDKAEVRHNAKLAAPEFIAAAAKRERRRSRNLGREA